MIITPSILSVLRSSRAIADLFPNISDYLHWLSCNTKVYIHRLTDKSRLVLYGGTYAERRRACTILMTKVQQLKNEAYTIVSDYTP